MVCPVPTSPQCLLTTKPVAGRPILCGRRPSPASLFHPLSTQTMSSSTSHPNQRRRDRLHPPERIFTLTSAPPPRCTCRASLVQATTKDPSPPSRQTLTRCWPRDKICTKPLHPWSPRPRQSRGRWRILQIICMARPPSSTG